MKFDKAKLPAIIALVGAILIVICAFLPYASANKEAKDLFEMGGDKTVVGDLTYEDMIDVSMLEMVEYANSTIEMAEEAGLDEIDEFKDKISDLKKVPLAVYGILILGIAAAVCAFLKKPIITAACAAVALVVNFILKDGVMVDDMLNPEMFDTGIGFTLIIIGAVAAVAGSVWQILESKKVQE